LTDNPIGTFAVNPVVAWKLNPCVSLGAGFYDEYATLEAERMMISRRGDGRRKNLAQSAGTCATEIFVALSIWKP
jgi:long-subunit fatty acid transport protein